jgi:predicted aspartyl protease
VFEVFRRRLHVSEAMRGSRSWSRTRNAVTGVVAIVAIVFSLAAPRAVASPLPDVATLLEDYTRATTDPGASEVTQYESVGTLLGGGLTGEFHSWAKGDNERTDENLGPRSETTLRIGSRIWDSDANGGVRELTGVLARRERTQDFIDSGNFAKAPERSVFRGIERIGGRQTYALDVTAENGETETLYLDAETALPDRVAYDDDDGRTTVDLSDWRDVGGHRYPFKSIVSDGDRAFDTVQTTTSISLSGAIPPKVFAPLVPRTIAMAAPDTIPIDLNEGHLYAPVTIGGKHYTFLLDTGAQDILIDKHVAQDLGLTPIGALEASGATRTGGLQLVKLDEIDVGSGRLTNIIADTIDLNASTSGVFHIDGILGYPFFAAATVRIDYSAKTMTFGPPGSIAPTGEKIAVQVDRSFPEATLRLDDQTDAPFIIDTGNAGEVLLYKPLLEKHGGIVPFSTSNRHSYGIGGSTTSYRTSLESITLGSVPIYHAETDVMLATSGAFADRFDAGNVGLGLLKNFVLTFDVANAAIYLERGADFDDGRNRI